MSTDVMTSSTVVNLLDLEVYLENTNEWSDWTGVNCSLVQLVEQCSKSAYVYYNRNGTFVCINVY